MTTKLVALPDKTMSVTTEDGGKKTRNILLQFAMIALEGAPHKTDTEAYIAHTIREKLDEADENPKTREIELELPEIKFLKEAIDRLRAKEQVGGSGWYYLIEGLQEAKEKPKMAKVESGKK